MSQLEFVPIPERCDLCRSHEARFCVWENAESHPRRLLAKICRGCRMSHQRSTPEEFVRHMQMVFRIEPRTRAIENEGA